MTCPCGLTRLEFKLWGGRALFQGSRWNIEIAAVAFALLPSSRDIPSLWHLSANQSDGQLTWGEQRRGLPSQFVLVCLVKAVEWLLDIWRHTALLRWCSPVYLVVKHGFMGWSCCDHIYYQTGIKNLFYPSLLWSFYSFLYSTLI